MDPRLDALNRSLPVDRKLWREDLATNRAWVHAIHGAGVLTAPERDALLKGLDAVEKQLAAGAADTADDEDIHTLIERLLGDAAGQVAGKLHSGRSRNDQVATDLRLWTMRALGELDAAVTSLIEALAARAEGAIEIVMPSYTHTQRAQPVRAAHWLLSHCWALHRDRGRLSDARRRAAVLPLGSGAIAGSGFAVDRDALAKRLGFDSVSPNSMDAVGDRDFAIEAVFAATLLTTHLSRLAEDLILFSTTEFGFVTLSDPFTTGSSLMPQKKNPDSLELIRGTAPQLSGRLVAMLGAMKAMPSGYQKDLQDNNVALFTVLESAAGASALMAGVVQGMALNAERMGAAIDPATLATEVADLLVKAGVPFRESHHIVGELVRRGEELGAGIDKVPSAELARIDPRLAGVMPGLGGAEEAVERRTVAGGTARERIRDQLEQLRRILHD